MYSCLERDLALAVRQVLFGWDACLTRNGVVVLGSNGKRLGPALAILESRLAGTGGKPFEPVSGDKAFAFADKVLGLAAFRLAYLCGARYMWGLMTSALAVWEGKRRGIFVGFHRLVPAVMNADMDGLCPMENLSWRTESDWEFYIRLREDQRRVAKRR